jgi:hypothetical protein
LYPFRTDVLEARTPLRRLYRDLNCEMMGDAFI